MDEVAEAIRAENPADKEVECYACVCVCVFVCCMRVCMHVITH
jgi:hypothetical protein